MPLLAVVLLLFSAGAPGQEGYDAALLDVPESPDGVVVNTEFHLLQLIAVDDEAEEFTFSGILTLVWQDDEQAFDVAEEGAPFRFFNGTFQFNELAPAWYPQVVFSNLAGALEDQGTVLRISPDGTSRLTQAIVGRARADLDMARFPFDTQRLDLNLLVLGFSAAEVQLVAASDAISREQSGNEPPQWTLTDIAAEPAHARPDRNHVGSGNSALVITLTTERKPLFMLRLVIFPLGLIVLLSWSVFWMDRSSLGDRMNVSFVGILTAVAYQIMISDIMPHVSQMSFLNAYVFISMVVMAATVLVNLVVGECDSRNKQALGDRIDTASRWIFPVSYLLLVWAAWLLAVYVL